MKKKVLATLLATAMVAGCLAGCGNDGAANTPAEEAPAATEETPAATEEAPAATEEAPAEDAAATDASDPIATLIANTTGTVTMTVWASEEDQDLTSKLLDEFKAAYPDVTFDITLGAESESTAKDTVLTDVEAAADVYAFADDQINELVQAGALQEVAAHYTYDVAAEKYPALLRPLL